MAGKYYEYLKKGKRENYREIFMLATKHYAMQRGSRMAQRALRDGQKLDYATFCRYGEWIPSREMLNAGEACAKVEISVEPDYEYHVTYCPWNRQFVDMGQEEAGRIYCGCLDEAILRGFNEAVKFRTVQTRYEGAECIFHIKKRESGPEKFWSRNRKMSGISGITPPTPITLSGKSWKR